ncbi:MAG TPA: hypothetical protein VFF70_00705, partial [Anaerolineae bacterium]|nr:hypothetical protein [Anaerolineae bacterium]
GRSSMVMGWESVQVAATVTSFAEPVKPDRLGCASRAKNERLDSRVAQHFQRTDAVSVSAS